MLDRLKRILNTDGGAALVAALEREADEKADIVRQRRELGAQIAAAECRRHEEFPPLEAVRLKAVAEHDAALKELQRAEQAVQDAAAATFNVRWSTDNSIRAARSELRRTAEKWLHEARDHAHDRLREYHNYGYERLHYWRHETVGIAPDATDPDYKAMRRAGATYRMRRVGSNSAALTELREAMSKAIDRLDRFTEPVEPPTKAEVDAVLAIFSERTWKQYADRVTWSEPTPPRYDENGAWIGTN